MRRYATINVYLDVLDQFRPFVFAKRGKLHGAMVEEASEALAAHMASKKGAR